MEFIKMNCPAKINIALDVCGKRDDGYHLLKMIMQSVSLHDEVSIEKKEKGIIISSNIKDIPCDERNTAYKAADIIIKKYNIKSGVKIHIEKNIPHGAGLGGGSSDAAGVIEGMNKLFDLNLSFDEMKEIGVMVGADVPFCLLKGTVLAEGIGEVLTPLKSLPKTMCLIAKPPVAVSTKEVFSKFNRNEFHKKPDIESLVFYIESGDIPSLSKNMGNVLEDVTVKDHPIISEIKKTMLDFGALGSLMSGSGPSVFGFFSDEKQSEECYRKLKNSLDEVYLVTTE